MVGIGGIGLSALAQLFHHEGAIVSGSDRSDSPTTHMLDAVGIVVHIGHTGTQVPEDTAILVYSDAIVEGSEGFAERVKARELGIPELSYFEALGKVAKSKKVIAVSGTNGKTTTTAMIAKILIDAGEDPTVVVGSIAADLKSNFRAGNSDLFVVEACEYKRHLLTFHPHLLVITNIELDHTDYFTDLSDIESAFCQATRQVEPGGYVVVNTRQEAAARVLGSEGLREQLERVGVTCVEYATEEVGELLLPGEFNIENARAAKATVHAIAPHVAESVIDHSLRTFRGTWRRFEYKGVLPSGALLYDDYAHHPTAIEKTITAAKNKFVGKKVVLFFHPHLYSRTRDLFDAFAQALATADEVFILPVYAAREAYDERVSNAALAEAVNKVGGCAHEVAGMQETTTILNTLGSDVVAFTMGAGDVYKAGEEALT